MKKNPRNEIKGIVVLLVACLIWGIYVLNAEAATVIRNTGSITIYDGIGNEVGAGTAAIGDFTVIITVPLIGEASSENIVGNPLTIKVNETPKTYTSVSGTVEGNTVRFKVSDPDFLRFTGVGDTVYLTVSTLYFGYGDTSYQPEFGIIGFTVGNPTVSVTMEDQYVTYSSAVPAVMVGGKTWDWDWTGYNYDKTYYSISEDGSSERVDNSLNIAGLHRADVTVSFQGNEIGTASTQFNVLKLGRVVTGFSVTGYREGSGESLDVNYGTFQTGNHNGLNYPNDNATPTVSYKLQGEGDSAYLTEEPTAAGSYVARLSYDETDYYKPYSTTVPFEILPAYGYALKIQVADIAAGETPSPVVTDGENNLENNSEVKYVVEYKASDAADTAYSVTAPATAGTYVARVSLYNSSGTFLKSATATFKIGKQSGNGTITVESIRYGSGTVKPVVASETNGTGNVRVEYKLAEASDSTYSTTVPTIPGKYSARAIFAPTDQYEEVVAVTKFEIYKAYGTANVSVKDIYYGMEVNARAITNASNAGTAVLEYKQTGAEDSTYSTTVPTEIGSYTVRATYPESAYYFSFYATGKFEITYMPTPEFVLNGTTGRNDYFTSDVVVTTQPGYLISGSLDGEYASSLSLSDGNTVSYLYFMEEATGAKSAGVSTAGIKIDTISPQFSNLPTTNIIYSDTWTTTISDLHLASVMLNGEKQDVNGNSLRLELDAEGGQKELELVATDDAGNTEKLLFTLAATWLEEKEIPVGQTISLEAGTAYQLGEGTWQIDNDSTTYAGGSTVYIREEGQYVFSNH